MEVTVDEKEQNSVQGVACGAVVEGDGKEELGLQEVVSDGVAQSSACDELVDDPELEMLLDSECLPDHCSSVYRCSPTQLH